MARNIKSTTTPEQATILLTIPKAVDKVCAETAAEIEATAKQLMVTANEVAGKLNELATAVREHGRIAEEHVTKWCGDAKHTMETVHRLQSRLAGTDEAPTTERLESNGQLEVTELPHTDL